MTYDEIDIAVAQVLTDAQEQIRVLMRSVPYGNPYTGKEHQRRERWTSPVHKMEIARRQLERGEC